MTRCKNSRLPMFPTLAPSGSTTGRDSTFRVGHQLAIASTFSEIRDPQPVRHESSPLKSRSIPITNRMKRTPSELQLREDEELADFRDYVMFTRIVDRLARQQNETKDFKLRQENDLCLAHIISTRNGSQDVDANLKAARQRRQHEISTEYLPKNFYMPNQQILSEIQDILTDDDDDEMAMFKLDL